MTSQASSGSDNAARAGLASIWVRSWGPQISSPWMSFTLTVRPREWVKFSRAFPVDAEVWPAKG